MAEFCTDSHVAHLVSGFEEWVWARCASNSWNAHGGKKNEFICREEVWYVARSIGARLNLKITIEAKLEREVRRQAVVACQNDAFVVIRDSVIVNIKMHNKN